MPMLRLLPTEVELWGQDGEAILSTVVRDGFKYRIGCRRGGCGICKATLLSGSVGYPTVVAESVLSAAERESGVVLTCRAVPETDVVVQFSEESRLRLVAPLAFGLASLGSQRAATTEAGSGRKKEQHAR